MENKGFIKRIGDFGFSKMILSPDTFIAIITFFIIYIFTKGIIEINTAKTILQIFIQVTASLFAIVLAGLAIVTSFTDKEFVYMWKKAGQFDNMITLFQYNLFTPIFVLLFSLFLSFVYYNSILMIVAVSLFMYMIFSLIDLINFICKYGLQRGEFVKNYIELKQENKKKN